MDITGSVTLTIVICISCLLFYSALKTRGRRGNLPPGPTPLPFLGNILQLRRGELVESLLELSETYGSVFTVYLGMRRVVVLKGYQTVKEALVHQADDFSGRGEIPTIDRTYKNYGVAFTNNMERWRQLRRFTLVTLRDFGMGKRGIEDRIKEEIQYLISELRKTKGTMFNPSVHLSLASCNIMSSIMFGDRFEYDNKDLLSMVHVIHESFELISSACGQLYEMLPGLMKHLPGKHRQIFRDFEILLAIIEKRVEMSRRTLDPSSPRHYIDTFLIKMDKEKQNPDTEFTMPNLLCSTAQIIYAASDTTSTTLTYGFLLLLRYPAIQERVQEEIDRVVGQNRTPNIQDKSEMPYTDAVIHEIQRFIDLVPSGVPRAVIRDVLFKGYTIPKGTNVFAMLGTVLKDPECFSDPDNFNPKNFLDERGGFKKSDAFMPFSAGKRNCLGEGLARMELFLIFTTILQSFNLKSALPPEELDITPNVTGLGNFPRFYNMYIEPR
ncbi:cytochrome P450 2A4-like isoform X2 [Ascaphus truei]|uniref:cytochrome P450 2A4-like isoform X2 n=1 Tax=Ascaphus truei TaxID=8439 RepID=UPI003F590C0C